MLGSWLIYAIFSESKQFVTKTMETRARTNDAPPLLDVVTVVEKPQFAPLAPRGIFSLLGRHVGSTLTLNLSNFYLSPVSRELAISFAVRWISPLPFLRRINSLSRFSGRDRPLLFVMRL